MKAFKDASEAMNFLEEEKTKQINKSNSNKDPRKWRFYLRYGESANVVFLDDLLFMVYEHRLKVNDEYVFETCIQGLEGDCPGCDSGNPYRAMVTTIIHLDPKKKDGTVLAPQKKLLVAKTGNAERILTRQNNFGTIVGKKFWIKRSQDSKGEASGTDLEYIKDADWESLKKLAPEGVDVEEWLKPYDYESLFQPKSPSEFRSILGFSDPVGGSSEETPSPNGNNESGNDLSDLV